MTPELIQAILWIPFAIIVLIAGVIFCISGYQKGLWRALIALGATVVAALLSILLAKLLSAAIAPAVWNSIAGQLEEINQIGMVASLLEGLVGMVVSLVLFSLMMFIFTIVLRIVSYHIKKEKLCPTKKSMRFGGMAVGAVSAVIYTLLLLMPLYGTLGAYVPAVETLLSLQQEQGEAQNLLRAISMHPVVKMSGSGPVSAAYGGLVEFQMGEATVNIPQMTEAMDKTMTAFENVMSADGADAIEKAQELIQVLRQEVVETPWFYSLSMEVVSELQKELDKEDIEGKEIVLEILDILDCPRKEFGENCAAILDFMGYALEQDIVSILDEEDMDRLYSSGIVQQAGALANVSEQSVAVKELLLSGMLYSAFDDNFAEASAFLDRHELGAVTDPKEQEREAEVFLMLLSGEGNRAEMIMRHPNLGEPAFWDLVQQSSFAEAIGLTRSDEAYLAEFLNNNAQAQQKVVARLKQCAAMPMDQSTFLKDCRTMAEILNMAEGEDNWYLDTTDAQIIRFAFETIGKERLASAARAGAAEWYTLSLSAIQTVEKNPELIVRQSQYGTYREDYLRYCVDMFRLFSTIKSGKMYTSASKAWSNDPYDVLRAVDGYLESRSMSVILEDMINAGGKDPLGLGRYMNSSQKSALKTILGEIVSNYSGDARTAAAEKAAIFRKFFQIS